MLTCLTVMYPKRGNPSREGRTVQTKSSVQQQIADNNRERMHVSIWSTSGHIEIQTLGYIVAKVLLWVYGVNSPTRRIMENEGLFTNMQENT
ncbi:hypothetical protein AVEN_275344-1 [Araneus ventricosus]|uniref:Uncharacterized protein n=1 Tax=Araneus ventricosus TaxID=182803 RepID=A0A4Y2MZE6_ARAVE|nr:hypothetical protein AVEN_275344-1 [Araneus ventricosus]